METSIILEPDLLELATWMAIERDKRDEKRGYQDRLATRRDPIENSRQSICAEFATARLLNLCPNLHVDPDYISSQPDLFGQRRYRLDVKWIPQRKTVMSIRADRDYKVDFYVGVVGLFPRFSLAGYIAAEAARIEAYLVTHPPKEGAPPYYAVPLSALTRF